MSKFLQKAVGRGLREAGAVLKEEGGAEVRQEIQSLSPLCCYVLVSFSSMLCSRDFFFDLPNNLSCFLGM